MEHPPKHSRSCSESSTRSDPTGGFRYKEKRSHTPVLTKLHWLPVAALNIFRPSDIQKNSRRKLKSKTRLLRVVHLHFYLHSKPPRRKKLEYLDHWDDRFSDWTSIVLEKPSACERCQDCVLPRRTYPQSGTIYRLNWLICHWKLSKSNLTHMLVQ